MKTYEAVAKRIEEICQTQGRSICDICLRAGMSPSNIYALLKGRTKISKVDTIRKFAEGAEMSLEQFFASPLFDNIDDE